MSDESRKSSDKELLLSEYGVSAKKGVSVLRNEEDPHRSDCVCRCMQHDKGLENNVTTKERTHFGFICALCITAFVLVFCMVGFIFYKMQLMQMEQMQLRDQFQQLQKECQRSGQNDVVAAGGGGLHVGAGAEMHSSMPEGGSRSYFGQVQGRWDFGVSDENDEREEEDDIDDDDDEDDAVDGKDNELEGSVLLKRIRRNAGTEKSGKQKDNKKKKPNSEKKPGKDKDKHCKRFEKCLKNPRAVHYQSKFWQDEGGSRTKSEFGKETPLKIFKPADWMETEYPGQSGQPVTPGGDGGYIVQESGLYLIYSSVLFHDVKHRQSQAVVVNGHKLFKCMDSVDYIDEDLPKTANQAKYKTCAMTGVTQLKKNDRLEVQNLYANTEIDLSDDATYFGAVLLAPSK